MGQNVDLTEFGLCNLKCKQCKELLDLTEVDIDCDLKTHNPNTFELNIQCFECHKDNEMKFEIKRIDIK